MYMSVETSAAIKLKLAATMLLAIVMAVGSAIAQEPKPEVREVPIYVEIEPAEIPPGATKVSAATTPVKTLMGLAVKIRGVAAQALSSKQLQITVTPPQGPKPPVRPKPESESPPPKDKRPKPHASA